MGTPPDEMSVVVVDDLYLHYDVMYDDSDELVHVYCDRCDDFVAVLSYDNITSMDEIELYEYIIEIHRKI